MSDAIIGALRVVLGMDSAAFEEGFSKAQKTLNKGAKEFAKIGEQFKNIGQTLSVALTLPLVAIGIEASKAATESADAFGQIEARLKSMGNVSGRTAEQLQALAGGFQDHSLFDDDDILRQLTATLLTFGNISGPVFDVAEQNIVDLAAAMGGDLQGATVQIGKALNDPINGLTALRKIGVSFTEEQQKQIKTMVEHGQMAKAQGIILNELSREFGGAAQAARDNDPFATLKESGRNFMESVGGIINKAIVPLVDAATRALTAFNNLSPGMQSFIVAGAAIAAALGPVIVALGGVASGLGSIMTFLASDAVAAALPALTAALGPIAIAAAAVAAVFIADWPKIAPVLKDLWQQAQDALGSRFTTLIDNINDKLQEFWNSGAGEALRAFADWLGTAFAESLRAFGQYLIETISNALSALNDFVNYIADAFRLVNDLIHGNWAKAWQDFKNLVNDGIEFVIHAVGSVVPAVGDAMQAAYNKIAALIGLQGDVASKPRAAVESAAAGITAAAPKVARAFQAAIEQPTKKAVDAAKKALDELKSALAGVMATLATPDETADIAFAKQVDTLRKARAADLLDEKKYQEELRRARQVRDDSYGVGKYTPNDQLGDNKDRDIGPSAYETSIAKAAQTTRDQLGAAWKDVGMMFKGAFQEALIDGKVNWNRFIIDILNNWNSVAKVIAAAFKAYQSGGIGGAVKSVLSGIGFNANGTDNWPGGLSMVGERGPEVVNLPRGASVASNENLRSALAGRSSSGASVIRVEIDKSDYFDTKVRQVAASGDQASAVQGAVGGAELARVQSAQSVRRSLSNA